MMVYGVKYPRCYKNQYLRSHDLFNISLHWGGTLTKIPYFSNTPLATRFARGGWSTMIP